MVSKAQSLSVTKHKIQIHAKMDSSFLTDLSGRIGPFFYFRRLSLYSHSANCHGFHQLGGKESGDKTSSEASINSILALCSILNKSKNIITSPPPPQLHFLSEHERIVIEPQPISL